VTPDTDETPAGSTIRTVAVCDPAIAVHGPKRQFFGHTSIGLIGTAASLSSTALPSSHVSGGVTTWLPHTVPSVVDVVLVEVVVVTVVLVLLVELVVGTLVLVVLVDDVLVELVVGTLVLVVLVDVVVVTVELVVLVELVVVTEVLEVVVTLVEVVVVGQRKTSGSAASSCTVSMLRRRVCPAASRQPGQRPPPIAEAARPSYLPLAFVSHATTSKGFPLKAACACLAWHVMTAPISLANAVATAPSHLDAVAVSGRHPV